MSDLNEYLAEKRAALVERHARSLDDGLIVPRTVKVRAEGRSGIRRIRIRDFQIISDSLPDLAGYDLGPGSPEILLGALGSCLTHTYLIQAAQLGVPLDWLEVDVSARLDPRASLVGKDYPVFADDINYVVHIESSASTADVSRLRDEVEKACPVLNFLQAPRAIKGRVEHKLQAADDSPGDVHAEAASRSRKSSHVTPADLEAR